MQHIKKFTKFSSRYFIDYTSGKILFSDLRHVYIDIHEIESMEPSTVKITRRMRGDNIEYDVKYTQVRMRTGNYFNVFEDIIESSKTGFTLGKVWCKNDELVELMLAGESFYN